MTKPVLEYESKSRRKRSLLWLIFFAAFCYAVGAVLCWGRSSGEMFGIMEIVTVVVVAITAVVAGIRLGTQDKDFWI